KRLRTGKEWPAWKRSCMTKASSIYERFCRPRWRPTKGRKKRGLQFALFLREKRLVQTLQTQDGAEQHRAYPHRAAVLRLPALQGQADPLGKLGGSDRKASRHASCPADDGAGRQRLLL